MTPRMSSNLLSLILTELKHEELILMNGLKVSIILCVLFVFQFILVKAPPLCVTPTQIQIWPNSCWQKIEFPAILVRSISLFVIVYTYNVHVMWSLKLLHLPWYPDTTFISFPPSNLFESHLFWFHVTSLSSNKE